MATSKIKAEAFVKAMDHALGQARAQQGIDAKDIDVRISVKVEDKVTYDYHEDED